MIDTRTGEITEPTKALANESHGLATAAGVPSAIDQRQVDPLTDGFPVTTRLRESVGESDHRIACSKSNLLGGGEPVRINSPSGGLVPIPEPR